MTCHDSEQYIQAFVDDKLTGDDLEAFLWHISNCRSCYDETETSYLLKEALADSSEDMSFDLVSELKEKIAVMERYVDFRNRASIFRRVVLTIAGMSLFVELMYLYLYYL